MIIVSIIVFLAVFSALVLVHEWGHFAAAKKSGVTVEEFALGFGKKIWGFHKDGTDFNLNLVPFGGFVRMVGEEEASDEPGSFEKAPLWARMFITVAGVCMNWIFAIVLLTVLFWHGTFPLLVSQNDVDKALEKGFISEQINEEGVSFYKYEKEIKLAFPRAFVFALSETGRISKAIVERVSEIPGEIIREKRMPEGLAGPLGIAEVTHKVLPMGIWAILKLTALLSISLAVMNLLPIPALDGGRLVLQIYELITRHQPNQHWERWLHFGGFIFLLAFLLAVTWNDVMRMFFS